MPRLDKPSLDRTKESDVKWIRDRLEDCRQNHAQCPDFGEKQLPTRVIDVGLGGQEPFLHISSNGEKGRYLALSHRWGDPSSSHKKLLTLARNIASRRQGIPLAAFPKTFREAIEVARGLGIQHMWIDSLCIVQDDKADWAVEAGRMASVYADAFATLFADRAAHSDDGLFQSEGDRETPQQRSVRVLHHHHHHHHHDNKDSGDAATKVFVQTQTDANTASFATSPVELFCQSSQRTSQLACRGWILQEECLSRRKVLFTSTELLWECPATSICDCGLRVPPSMEDPSLNFGILVADPGSEKARSQRWKTPAWLWMQIVEHYTARDLTFEADRLIALAGMVSLVPSGRADGGAYLGGVWREQLDNHVLWRAVSSKKEGKSRRTGVYVAPSWSWASISGRIKFVPLSTGTRFVWQVLDAVCVPKAQGSNGGFGQVASGYLRVKSQAMRVKLEERPQNMRKEIAQEHWDNGDTTWRVRGDGVRFLTVVPAQTIPGVALPLDTILELDVQSDWDEPALHRGPSSSDLRLLCVALVDTFWEGVAAERAICLLLRRSAKRGDCWERVCYTFLKGAWKSWEPYVFDEEVAIV